MWEQTYLNQQTSPLFDVSTRLISFWSLFLSPIDVPQFRPEVTATGLCAACLVSNWRCCFGKLGKHSEVNLAGEAGSYRSSRDAPGSSLCWSVRSSRRLLPTTMDQASPSFLCPETRVPSVAFILTIMPYLYCRARILFSSFGEKSQSGGLISSLNWRENCVI